MFFREKKTRSTPVLQLVENHRDNQGKVRQRLVLSLGGCRVPDEHRRAVAIEVSHRMAGYQRLLPVEAVVAHWTQAVFDRLTEAGKLPGVTCREVSDGHGQRRTEAVRIDEIEHERETALGPCLVLLRAWESLGIDEVLKQCRFGRQPRQTAKVTVFNRLIEPCSENELVGWAATTALDELLGVQTAAWAEDRFYRISDRLLKLNRVLERHLCEREKSLFRLGRTILLYDLTNSYFEGSAKRNPLARRSAASKEKRTDCPILSVGVVLDADGFLITHKVFRGNMNDCQTLVDAVETLECVAVTSAAPVVVVDGGMATDQNLQFLRSRGYNYVVNGKRQSRANFAEDFLDTSQFTKISGRDGKLKRHVFVRRIRTDTETVVLCRSDGRHEKEDAIMDGAERKLLDGLRQLHARVQRSDPRLKLKAGPALVNRAIGRITVRTTRASKLYDILYDHEARTLEWHRREEDWRQARDLHGCYHLRSSLDLPDEELWKLYMTLTRVEDSFRMMKAELGLRPFRHHTEQRCQAHVWITILAYHLLRWVEHTLELSGYQATWRIVRRHLQTHGYSTVIVPTEEGLVHHTRKPGRPDDIQKLIYSLFGIDCKDLPVRKRTYRSS
jgi:hypothetical protein